MKHESGKAHTHILFHQMPIACCVPIHIQCHTHLVFKFAIFCEDENNEIISRKGLIFYASLIKHALINSRQCMHINYVGTARWLRIYHKTSHVLRGYARDRLAN